MYATKENNSDEEGKPEKVSTEFALTAGGTAVIERPGAHTGHEMVNMYNPDGKDSVIRKYSLFNANHKQYF